MSFGYAYTPEKGIFNPARSLYATDPSLYGSLFATKEKSGRAWIPSAHVPAIKPAKAGGLGELSEIGMGGAIIKLAMTGTAMASFYHGYKRNNESILWGFLWSFLGPLGLALALAQGFGKPL